MDILLLCYLSIGSSLSLEGLNELNELYYHNNQITNLMSAVTVGRFILTIAIARLRKFV